RQAFRYGGPAGREAVKARIPLQAGRLQASMPAVALGFLPQSLTLAGQSQVIFRPQENEMIDNGWLRFHARQLDFQILGFARPAAQEQPDADFPRLTISAYPMRDRHHAVGRMIAKTQLADDVLKSPRADFDA